MNENMSELLPELTLEAISGMLLNSPITIVCSNQ